MAGEKLRDRGEHVDTLPCFARSGVPHQRKSVGPLRLGERRRSKIGIATYRDMSNPGPTERIREMKHLLSGVAVVAALAFCAPVSAQPANPSGGNALGLPGPNPGGPGLTPYSTGAGRPVAAPAMAPPPAASAPPMSSDTSSAMPPKHRHSHASHGKMAGHHARHGKGPQLTGNTANQLNQEELQRLQAGNFSNPAAPSPPGAASPATASPATVNRMPAGGRATSGGTRGGGR